jgi:ribonuclease HII
MIDFKANNYVIGVDEVGVGPLAGPVVAAAVLVDVSVMEMAVKDSKLLSAGKREQLAELLSKQYKYSIAVVEPSVIDKINILNATKKAMALAISELWQFGDYPTYIDGNRVPFTDPKIRAIVKGDMLLKPISAASIVAKVARDKIMLKLSREYPKYGWERNVGYGTKTHIEAIREFGSTEYHRQSFLSKIAKGLASCDNAV